MCFLGQLDVANLNSNSSIAQLIRLAISGSVLFTHHRISTIFLCLITSECMNMDINEYIFSNPHVCVQTQSGISLSHNKTIIFNSFFALNSTKWTIKSIRLLTDVLYNCHNNNI